MRLFMLDTDTVSFALRGQGQVAQRLTQCKPSEVCISSITLAELQFGAERRKSRKLRRLITQFTTTVEVAPFDAAAAITFGKVATKLANNGQSIGIADTLIASHALSLGLTIVTNNTRHFSRIRQLKRDNWL